VGLQPVRECVRVHGRAISQLTLCTGQNPKLAALERFARTQGVLKIERVSRGDMDRLARGAQHQGAIAVAPDLQLQDWDSLLDRPDLIAVALDRLQDPQNFGAVVRSAVATTGAAVLWGEHSSAPLSPATFRASAGAIEHATLCRTASLADALRGASSRGINVVGLASGAENLLSDIDLTGPTVIVVGSEGNGLLPAVKRSCTQMAAVLRTRTLDSLNASVAAAIALYEVSKQRAIIGR
jgi:23S rRNA (guanosine2251-2'-O)-methyltransferase